MRNFILGISIIALISISCNKENNEINKVGIIPLRSGNTWTYEVHRTEIDGHDTIINHGIDSINYQIGDYVKIKGIYGFKFLNSENLFNLTILVDNDANGNFVTVGEYNHSDTLIEASIRYLKDAHIGDSWDNNEIFCINNSYFEERINKIYCIKTDTLISTPKGEFNCKVFKWYPNNNSENSYIEYVSENIGIVKWEYIVSNIDLQTIDILRYQLIDYKIGN
jgi:hypothetical protein